MFNAALLQSLLDQVTEDDILLAGAEILMRRAKRDGIPFTSPKVSAEIARRTIGHLPHEEFVVFFLDNQHRLIEQQSMFRGTLDACHVYPREIVKAVLQHNAAAVLLAHNHPSGELEPSRADIGLTRQVRDALTLVDVRVLDHLVVTEAGFVSFAERGLM
jgi:DNA repair protein RadC